MTTEKPLSILVLGASYGLLPGLKLACAGHIVTLVGRKEEIATMAAHGLAVHLTVRRSGLPLTLRASVAADAAPFSPSLRTPQTASAKSADLVILALQEPQFADDEIVALMTQIGLARRPCLSIMNLPPPPFLERLRTIPVAACTGVYSSMEAWREIDPLLLTLASPDAQAIRLNPSLPGELTVTLPSNFKCAPFANPGAQAVLKQIAHDMSHLKVQSAIGEVRAPVALLVSESLHVPLAKWPMLLAGNCRCVLPNGVRSIAEAVTSDLAESRVVYEAVTALALDLGARSSDMVSFETYAKAAVQLVRPSSLARALAAGARAVERIDRLIFNLLDRTGRDVTFVAPIVDRINSLIDRNNSKPLGDRHGRRNRLQSTTGR